MIGKLNVEKGWSLFLDRDGVINQRIPDDYVKHPDEFQFIPGVTEALRIFAGLFNPILVVTNQQGIGRGLMTEPQLGLIHKKMLAEITKTGGRIDAVFYSPDLKNVRSFTRKPAIGLGLKARKQFPSINFKNSIMAGDTYSDILFGHRLGMITVLIGTDKKLAFQCSGILDFTFPDLLSFSEFLNEKT
jgi:histidinol-phosphate phosphatase family protein